MLVSQILKQYYGYDAFRKGQEPLIQDILQGKDVLGIMPTGAGKSVCFQVPALVLPGLTLVISPLISLMKDQVNSLNQSGIAAVYINSSLTEYEIQSILQEARNGKYKLMYIAPERLLVPNFLIFAKSVGISMLTVDEAHCISQWGQDFRQSYAQIPQFIAELSRRPIVSAFTATATKRVQEDIIAQLRLCEPTVLVSGFDRANLYFEVRQLPNEKAKFASLSEFLETRKDRSGIIYCSTRSTVEQLCDTLNNDGYRTARYHAGLSVEERNKSQEDFLFDRVKIIVATNAFGMGIDKSNVSFVVHYNMPKDIESYYQEAGRAGRDGEPADCLLLYARKDIETNRWLIFNSDNQDITPQSKQRELDRLTEMSYYCTTTDCLRGYILRYFGEIPPDSCDNCGNCNIDFEQVDVTVDTQKILSCVGRMYRQKGWYYGSKMLIDVLRGRKVDKVIQAGFDSISTFGICQKGERELRVLIEHLIQKGYLAKTADEYPVITLGARANAVLREGEIVTMRVMEYNENKNTEKIYENTKTGLYSVDKRLYEILAALRLEIANEQNVPAFTIFHNSTLTDMCMKLPQNIEGFMDISGVGKVKAEQYGTRFINAITAFLETNEPQKRTSPSDDAKAAGIFDTDNIEITEEPISPSALADRINCVLIQAGYKKLSAQRINNWLVSRGYMEVVQEGNRSHKIPTEKGAALGITSEEMELKNGETGVFNSFSVDAQRYVAVNCLKILGLN